MVDKLPFPELVSLPDFSHQQWDTGFFQPSSGPDELVVFLFPSNDPPERSARSHRHVRPRSRRLCDSQPVSPSWNQENLDCRTIWVFPKIGGKPPKWMVKIMENPIKMDDLGVPPFSETSISIKIERNLNNQGWLSSNTMLLCLIHLYLLLRHLSSARV